MFCLHLFFHPEWYSEGVYIKSIFGEIGDLTTKFFSSAGGICVEIFAFTSGYALWLNRDRQSIKIKCNRLIKFLVGYWLVYCIFLIIGYLNDDELPTFNNFLINAVGINVGPKQWVNVPFAWYICYYVEFVLLSSWILKVFSKRNKWIDLATCIAVILLIELVQLPIFNMYLVLRPLTYIWPLLASSIGLLANKYQVLDKLGVYLTNKNLLFLLCLDLLLIGSVSIVKKGAFYIGDDFYPIKVTMNAIIAMWFIAVSVSIIRKISVSWIMRLLTLLGTMSMYLWYWHGVFFMGNNIWQPMLYFTKEPLLILLFCFVITIPLSYLTMKIHNRIIHY